MSRGVDYEDVPVKSERDVETLEASGNDGSRRIARSAVGAGRLQSDLVKHATLGGVGSQR